MNDNTFFSFYEERINRVVNKLQNGCRNKYFCSESVCNDIAIDLYKVFHRASVRCLITELHICKNTGLLHGETAKEEYDSYCNLLENEEYINTVYQKYPGLLQYLDKLEKIQFIFWEEFLERLTSDWKEIRKYFYSNVELGILSVKLSGSDFHCKGKSVVFIETNQKKKLLYKPHSVENEKFLQSLLADIYKALGLKEFTYLELERAGYGWVEEVTWEECNARDEVAVFYKRVGVLAAVAYVLGIGDLHYENIIAHGEFPVIIDAETIFQHMGSLYQWTENTTAFYSVLSSGLFPGGTTNQNIAGITGGRNCICTVKIPIILYDKTSEICIDYQNARMPEGKNCVRYRGKVWGWERYEKEIIDGFKKAYDWLYANSDEVLNKVTVLKDKLKSRYVSGDTQFFALSLFASTHPKLMTSAETRYDYLRNLLMDRVLGGQEAEAIMQGDIPCFFRNIEDKDICNEQEITQKDFFEESIKESLRKRMQQISTEDCELQKKIIRSSFRLFGDDSRKEKTKVGQEILSNRLDLFNGVEYAKYIAELILENVVVQKDKIYWLKMEGEEDIRIKPIDIYFYSGIAGIAFFFRKLYCSCSLYGEVCEKLEKMLFDYTDHVYSQDTCSVTEYPGMYCGEGSLVYTYQLLYRITTKNIYRKYACKHAKILIRCIKQESPFDLLYGNAGAIFVLCQQYIDTNDNCYLNEAKRALEYLENRRIESKQGVTWFECTEGNPICSIAHGNSGVLIAYAKIQSLLHNDMLQKRMLQIMKFEDQYYQKCHGNWADLRKKDKQYETYAWCNGGIGVIYARLLIKKWNSLEIAEGDIDDKIKSLLEKLVMRREMCICHGNMGILLVLQEAVMCCSKDGVKETIIRYIDKLKESLLVDKRYLNKMDMGFMNGLAGVGIGIILL